MNRQNKRQKKNIDRHINKDIPCTNDRQKDIQTNSQKKTDRYSEKDRHACRRIDKKILYVF